MSTKTRESIDTSAVKLPWVSITPLGAPVLPEVKKIAASALRSISGLARRAAAQQERAGELVEFELDDFTRQLRDGLGEPAMDRLGKQGGARLGDPADRAQLLG